MPTSHNKPHHKKFGFTLVELSIVIVIIGLLVGGVMAGMSLVKQAQIRSIFTEKSQFEAAINSFRLEYNGFPGDIRNAQQYWASTLGGNGNGIIEHGGTSTDDIEGAHAWEQLALAKLIPGSYTGKNSATPVTDEIIPASQYSNGYWAFLSHTGMFPGHPIALVIGQPFPLTAQWLETTKQLFVPSILYAMDKKADDGLAGSGKMQAFHNVWSAPFSNACHDGGPQNNRQYDNTQTTIQCALSFIIK